MNNEDDRNNGDGSKLTTSRAANGLQAIAPEGAQESHSDLRQAGQPPRQAFAHRLSPIQLRRPSRNERFEFGTTAELPYVRDIIGQPRGVRAIEFGIKIDGAGYNIFMLGPSGSGRTTAVRRFLERQAREGETPHDWAYVYNFKTPHKPRALMLPTGKGALFRDAMEGIVTNLRRQIPHVLDAEEFRQGVEELDGDLVRKRGRIMEELLLSAAEKQLSIVRASAGLAVVPISNGQPVSPENFAQLPEAQRQLIEENSQMLQRQLDAAVIAENKAERETAQAKHTLEADAVAGLLDTLLTDVKAICADNHKALRWLDDFRQDILDGLDSFKTPTVGDKSAATELSALPSWLRQAVPADTWFRRYRINLIVDHSANAGAPVVLEDLPTFKNLVGYIESEIHTGGASSADFTMIKPGALHMANGGYLIIQAKAILKQSYAWEALKRALRSSVIRIEDPELRDGVGVLFPQTPAPEPIPLSIKVIMLGTAERYYTLQSADDEFAELFKVKADFSDTMARNDETELQYAHFVAARCHEGHLPHFDATGVTSIIQFGSWLAEDQTRLSTRFGEISNLIHEAAHWTLIAGNEVVSDVDVQRAIEERTYRNNLVEEEIQRSVLEGRLFIDTAGEIVGQVNALSVLRYGDYYFGQPNRVTARAFLGNEGVINIEREVEMAGPLHNKGLLTLTGYLGGQYALEHPLSLTASLAFEQNYGGIDGDSASTAELFALLSALSGYPLRQELAVTGSVNQLGKVQPIGAATQKIEGFYKICKERGLTGSQGVIIPASNVMGLMLSNELVSAVEKGQFHVYAVETIDQGIEILTGMAAGERDSGGSFPAGTVHHAVQARLQDMAMKAQRFSV
jgi:predicted ATP-dependent protease